MRMLRFVMWLGLCSSMACANALDEPDEFSAEDVGVVASALGPCTTLLRRSSLLEGFVDTLSCGTATCTRSCSVVDPTQCSTRCVPNNFGAATEFLDQSVLRPECRMDPRSRVNAGYAQSTKTLCETRGGCWDNRTRDPFYPWCYEKLGTNPTCGNLNPFDRVNAGTPRITGEQCVLARNACFDDRIRNVPFCFFPTSSTN